MQPTIKEFDEWSHNPLTKWYFDYILDFANGLAAENGRTVGMNPDLDHINHAINAGFINGLEEAVTHDPFIEVRSENETESDRQETAG